MPSPYPPLDDAALRAVYSSAPFPSLPPAYTAETLDMAVTFDLKPLGL
jgi:outer membrane biosynthesis protein TonB